jgi:hypothetical protein
MITLLEIYAGFAGLTGLVGIALIVVSLRRSKKKPTHHIFIQQDNWSK